MKKKLTNNYQKTIRTFSLVFIMAYFTGSPVFAQITFADDARVKADSRKIRREAAKYMEARKNAGDIKDSHLNMANYSYKKGEPGYRGYSEELETEEAYNLDNPINADTKAREAKKKGSRSKKKK